MEQRLYDELQAGIDPEWLRRTLQEMIVIRSENPFDDPPSADRRELEMAGYLSGVLSGLGMRHEWKPVRPDRPNVYGFLPGSEGHTTLALAGHMDTARTTGYAAAYERRYEDGRIYGRGACDMKAALAAYLAVAKVLQAAHVTLRGNLVLLFNVDEEYQMLGSQAIGRDGPRADQGIVGEPTNLAVCPSNKGRVSTKFITRGRAAHSSVPEQGVNAIGRMARIIAAFDDYNAELLTRPQHRLCGNGRFNPGVIHGGVQVNMVPDYCEMEVDRRTLPGETKDEVYAEFHARIARAGSGDPDFAYEITPPTWLIPSNDISPDEPVVVALRRGHQALWGRDPGVRAFVAGADAPHYGFPTVVCGPGDIAQAHTTNEWVALAEVVDAARLYLHVVLQLLS